CPLTLRLPVEAHPHRSQNFHHGNEASAARDHLGVEVGAVLAEPAEGVLRIVPGGCGRGDFLYIVIKVCPLPLSPGARSVDEFPCLGVITADPLQRFQIGS
ncbi:MAG: hypothetical protein M3Q71_20040, partial [Chloroflexota bacterium]|nr:hypothetical protein [Chloroflexota bacterium]